MAEDVYFHRLIAEATGNPYCFEVLDGATADCRVDVAEPG